MTDSHEEFLRRKERAMISFPDLSPKSAFQSFTRVMEKDEDLMADLRAVNQPVRAR